MSDARVALCASVGPAECARELLSLRRHGSVHPVVELTDLNLSEGPFSSA
jgi:hypothetical protein